MNKFITLSRSYRKFFGVKFPGLTKQQLRHEIILSLNLEIHCPG